MRRDGSRKGGRKRTAVTVVTVLPTADGGEGLSGRPAAHFPGPSALIRCMGRMKHGAWGALWELVRRTESTGPATR